MLGLRLHKNNQLACKSASEQASTLKRKYVQLEYENKENSSECSAWHEMSWELEKLKEESKQLREVNVGTGNQNAKILHSMF